jgi:hypothetical protein
MLQKNYGNCREDDREEDQYTCHISPEPLTMYMEELKADLNHFKIKPLDQSQCSSACSSVFFTQKAALPPIPTILNLS